MRAESFDVIKAASYVAPVTMFLFMEQLLMRQIQKPIDPGPNAEKQLCNLLSPSLLEWDAVSQVSSVHNYHNFNKHSLNDINHSGKYIEIPLLYSVTPLGSSYLVGKVFKYRYIEFFAFDYDSLPISFQLGIACFLQ